jgi:thiamine kinase-like enzyme
MQPETIAARLWPGRSPRIEPLGGGITNHNFKVSLDGDAYVLRIGGRDTELLGIERPAEREAAARAADVGTAPEVVAFLADEGVLVTRFVAGSPAPPERLRTADGLARVVAALKPFHEGPPITARFDSFRVVETYAATAADHGVAVPEAYSAAKELAGRIERALGARARVPCHNDLLNANFILDGERLWIVDWEYAGMGDVFFDLANFSVNHDLGPDEDDELLRAYFGGRKERDAAALACMRFMSDFREAMWGVVQQAISELDFDFVDYADKHFERLRGTAAAPRFPAALHTLEAN